MKKYPIILLAVLFIAFAGKEKLLNEKMPVVTGVTVDGTKIDSAFFSNKVTLIPFMYIGCPPCMKEIRIMNKLKNKYAGQDLNLLYIAPHTKKHMLDFNGVNGSYYSTMRTKYKYDSIACMILPECPDSTKSKVGVECNFISSRFEVKNYPTCFLVDKKGIIRKIYNGYPDGAPDDYIMEEFTVEIDKLLKEEVHKTDH